MRTFTLATVALILAATDATADPLTGRASVTDGDTIEIHGERIRILDIDAPESRQTCTAQDGSEWRCGQKASLALADWIGAHVVTCEGAKAPHGRWRTLTFLAALRHDRIDAPCVFDGPAAIRSGKID